jgi:hypothetical protein
VTRNIYVPLGTLRIFLWKTQVLCSTFFLRAVEVTCTQSSHLYLVSIYVARMFILVCFPPTIGHGVAKFSSFSLFTLTALYACVFSLVSIYFIHDFHAEDSSSLHLFCCHQETSRRASAAVWATLLTKIVYWTACNSRGGSYLWLAGRCHVIEIQVSYWFKIKFKNFGQKFIQNSPNLPIYCNYWRLIS